VKRFAVRAIRKRNFICEPDKEFFAMATLIGIALRSKAMFRANHHRLPLDDAIAPMCHAAIVKSVPNMTSREITVNVSDFHSVGIGLANAACLDANAHLTRTRIQKRPAHLRILPDLETAIALYDEQLRNIGFAQIESDNFALSTWIR
jgi:hypothetical protein